MHADELRMAVTKIVDILKTSNIRTIIDDYRAAKGDQRTAAAARLGHAGAVIMQRMGSLSLEEQKVVRCLHLESLGSTQYWQTLINTADEPRKQQAEIVRLASRVMFASSNLPGMISLMDVVKMNPGHGVFEQALEVGEGRLIIRLTDAGERASDPDRISRAIDGIDMLYSACASIARKPAMDLRLDGIAGKRNHDRELRFTGERDAIGAVFAVIDSIPATLADIDPDQDIDLDVVVQSLPIFHDLETLESLGTFSRKDLKDISDTMHQGALLTLESGVILVNETVQTSGAAVAPMTEQVTPAAAPGSEAADARNTAVSQQSFSQSALNGASARASELSRGHGIADEQSPSQQGAQRQDAERDEHYDRYLREREAMLKTSNDGIGVDGQVGSAGRAVESAESSSTDDQKRREAVDELLKSLGQSRSS